MVSTLPLDALLYADSPDAPIMTIDRRRAYATSSIYRLRFIFFSFQSAFAFRHLNEYQILPLQYKLPSNREILALSKIIPLHYRIFPYTGPREVIFSFSLGSSLKEKLRLSVLLNQSIKSSTHIPSILISC